MKEQEIRRLGHGAAALEIRARAALENARADLFERRSAETNYELAQELYRQYVDATMSLTRKMLELG